MPATLKKINEYLQSKVPGIELVKGRGYFYFADTPASESCAFPPDSICIYALNHQSLDEWKKDMDRAVKQFKERN